MLFITQPRVGRLHNEIIAIQMAARGLGWDVHPTDTSWRIPDETIAIGGSGVPYGSQTFCEVIAQQMTWGLIENPHNWLVKCGNKYLKRNVEFYSLGDMNDLTFDIAKFIKPADMKCFDAKVYLPGEFKSKDLDLPLDTPVLVSDVVEFVEEYRCFVCDGKCQTISCYRFHGEINEPKNWYNANCIEAEEFVNEVLMNVETKPSVVDIGLIKNVGWAVIESNQAWASGIYGCEPFGVLKVLSKTCYLNNMESEN